ncbi:MAG: hypothetical protein BGN96_02480 [Bacteroidales bacterium 45-6]|nr:MAG: hypothetical protein BGN96_02480 [Bacteroidales bacterium 45-6]
MNKKFGLFYCLALIVSLMTTSCGNSDSDLVGNWVVASTDFAGSTRGFASSFVVGNKLYVFGGYNGKDYYKDLWSLDLTSEDGSWTQQTALDASTATVTNPASAHYGRRYAAGFSIGTNGYIGGGSNGNDNLKDFWQYDTQANKWTQIADFPSTGRYGCYAFTLNNVGYVGGGYGDNPDASGQSFFSDLYSYDPSLKSWKQMESQGRKRGFASVFVINNTAYIFGGNNSSGAATDMWAFDGTKWTPKNEIYNKTDQSFDDDYTTIARYQAATFVINGKGYVTCGTSGSSLLKYTWEYNPITDLWQEKTSFEKSPRYGAIGATTANGVGIVLTGYNGSAYLDDANLFYPDATYNKND